MKQIPNYFTLLNLVFGCIAIICILQTGEKIVFIENTGFTSINLPENIVLGCFFIFCAAIIDFLDGFIARLFKAVSPLGAQLDSLADVVSFGVAPGLIMYQLLRIALAKEVEGLDASIAWLLPALLIPCAAAWRLAKFNTDDTQKHIFKGVPTPAAAFFIASLPILLHFQAAQCYSILTSKWVLYGLIILLSYLMVSHWKMMSLKIISYKVKENLPLLILAFFAIFSALVLQWLAIPITFALYVILSLIFKKK